MKIFGKYSKKNLFDNDKILLHFFFFLNVFANLTIFFFKEKVEKNLKIKEGKWYIDHFIRKRKKQKKTEVKKGIEQSHQRTGIAHLPEMQYPPSIKTPIPLGPMGISLRTLHQTHV